MQFKRLVWFGIGLLLVLVMSFTVSSFGQSSQKYVETVSSIAEPLEQAALAAQQSPKVINFSVLNAEVNSTVAVRCFDKDKIGFANLSGELVIPQCFISVNDFAEGLALVSFENVSRQERYGFINTNGEFAFPLTFLKNQMWASQFSEDLFSLRQEPGGKTGFINKEGQFVIEPQFDEVGGFREGLSVVCRNISTDSSEEPERRCGYIYPDGRLAAPLQFAQAESFYNGIASVRLPHKAGYTIVNNQTFKPLVGNILTSSSASIVDISSGLASVSLFGCRYDEGPYHHYGDGDDYYYPNFDLREIKSEERWSENLGYEYWHINPETLGFIDSEKGGFAIEPRFCNRSVEAQRSFLKGRAIVYIHPNDETPGISGHWRGHLAMINTNGYVVDNYGDEELPSYEINKETWREAEENLIPTSVRNGSDEPDSFGYISREGRWVIVPRFRKANNFQKERAIVLDAETQQYGLINTQGEYVIPPNFKQIKADFDHDLVIVQDSQSSLFGYMDLQ